MTNDINPPSGVIERIIEVLLAAFYIVLLSSIAVYSAGTRLSLSFRSASYAIGAVVVLVAVICALLLRKDIAKLQGKQKDLVLVCLCALGCAVVTASINRPDIDDSVYAPKAVFYTENPDAVLGNSLTWIAGLPADAKSFVFPYYETLQASLAWLCHVHFLDLYHVSFPFLVGFLAFCSVYLLLGLFYHQSPTRLAGTVCLILIALLLGETHRTYGNVSIARAFQGKFVLFYLGFYSWTYFCLKFFIQRHAKQLAYLSVVAVALTALTTTAFFYIPVLSLVLFIAYFLSRGELFSPATIKTGVWILVALLPTALLALNFRQEAQEIMSAGSQINSGFSSDFYDQLAYLVNRDFPISPVLFIVSLVMVIIVSPYGKFFVLWTTAAVALLLNPVVSGAVIKYVTTENAYWRLFYLLPFPLVSAVAFCSAMQRFRRSSAAACSMFVILLGLVLVLPSSVFRRANGAYFDFLSFKIHEPLRSYIAELSRTLAPGTMFAPFEIATNIVIYTSHFPEYYLREDYLGLVVGKYAGAADAAERTSVANYLYGPPAGPSPMVYDFMSRYRPEYVILNRSTANYKEAVNDLGRAGYAADALYNPLYQVWKLK